MTLEPDPSITGSTDDPISLSTGETAAFPLSAEVTVTGAVFGISLEQVSQMLPDGLTPIQSTLHQAPITVLCVEYHQIDSQEAIEPYNECTILLPAIPESTEQLPYELAFTRHIGGYVWSQSVTTESAKALSTEVWGYPTALGEITHRDTGSRRQTTVTVDDDHLLTVEIECPPPVDQTDSAARYTMHDGVLLQNRLEFSTGFGIWPAQGRLRYTLGNHPQAERLRELGCSRQALFRFAGTGEVTLYAGQPLY